MKKFILFFGILNPLFFGLSCDEDNDLNSSEYLVFGHFYGFCQGEKCIEIYKLTNDQLFEDRNDDYPNQSDFYMGDFEQLSDEAFRMADGLLINFPMDLLQENEKVIGLPDAGDWGGYYLEYKSGNIHECWLIDKKNDNIPSYLHPYTGELDNVITQLSN